MEIVIAVVALVVGFVAGYIVHMIKKIPTSGVLELLDTGESLVVGVSVLEQPEILKNRRLAAFQVRMMAKP